MFNGQSALVLWFAHLFNPPPLTTLTRSQKIARSFLVALTLFACCIAVATLAAVALYLAGHAHEMAKDRTTVAGVEIIFIAAIVNALCLRAILTIKRSA